MTIHRPLIPLPTISREYAHVKNELVGIICHLLAGVQSRSGVGVRYGVVDFSPGDLDQDRRRVWLAETLVVLDPVGVRDDSVRCVKLGQKIQRAESAVPAVRLVEHS